MLSPKLYVVRHYVPATSIKEAIKIAKTRAPDEVYVADEWVNKVGYFQPSEPKVTPAGYKPSK
jgi:hypothetical protein